MMNLTLLWTKWCLFALLRQCLVDKYFHHLALSDESSELFMHHWIIMEKNAEAFKKSFGGNLKKRWSICDRMSRLLRSFLLLREEAKFWVSRQEAVLEHIVTSFSYSLLLVGTSFLNKCMNDMHIYLQYLQDNCMCCCSILWAVVQCCWIMLLVLHEEMRDFTSVTKWHWKYVLFLLHLFSGIWKVMNTCSDCDLTSQMHTVLSLCQFILLAMFTVALFT